MATTAPLGTAVLYDPYPLWLGGVRDVLARARFDVVGTATAPEDAVGLVLEHRPALLVTEVDTVSTGHLAEAHAAVPTLRSVVLSASGSRGDVEAAFAAGASSYVLKTAHPDDVASAVRQAFRQSVFTRFAFEPSDRPEPAFLLTRRQRQILRLVAEGRSNAEVAQLLWVTEQTVKFHLANVYRKLGVANRTEASRWAHERGMLPEPVPALAA